MPAIDYVSIVRSVYGDRRALIFGAVASAITAGLSALTTQSLPLLLVTIAFVLVGCVRYFINEAFWKAGIGNEDTEAAEQWENRALIGGALVATVHGVWLRPLGDVIVVMPPPAIADADLELLGRVLAESIDAVCGV